MKPQDWTILVGLPAAVDEWRNCYRNPDKFDFFRQFACSKEFDMRSGRPMRDLLRSLVRAGCVVSRCGLNEFPCMFKRAKAVTLIAHWDVHGCVELTDGLHNWRDLANSIPEEYTGVLDLCVCHPDEMVRYLRGRFRDKLIKYKPQKPSGIVIWLGIYGVMAQILKEQDLPFGDTLVTALRHAVQSNLIAPIL